MTLPKNGSESINNLNELELIRLPNLLIYYNTKSVDCESTARTVSLSWMSPLVSHRLRVTLTLNINEQTDERKGENMRQNISHVTVT